MKQETKTKIKEWLMRHDRIASAVKIWERNGIVRFQACKGQQAYGHILTWTDDMQYE